ncbi:MAG: hypothetical protein Q8O89_00995 [Nanoarchaeota archaeon]|nr:hypothetical protein [Nanoarchaeota archaeon]
MTYDDYKMMFDSFNSSEGYYQACKILSFDSLWREKEDYRNKMESSIKETLNRLGKSKMRGADVCCGDYAWVPRHFSDYFSDIYCVDIDSRALDSEVVRVKKNCIVLNQNADQVDIHVDFLFSGNNVYEYFILNIANCVNPNGTIFLMKPLEGDDISLRSISKGYDINQRNSESNKISNLLSKYFKTSEKEVVFNWDYSNVNLDRLLASLSVVSFGERTLFDDGQYAKSVDYLKKKCKGDTLTLTQICKIWEGVKDG